MTLKGNKTASYKIQNTKSGNVYTFFCDVSGAKCVETSAYIDTDPGRELMSAWKTEAKKHFNLCHKCGKWVMDVMYNPDVFNCVQCSPIEDIPDYCPECGERISGSSVFCHKCGARLMYGGDEE